MPGPVKQAGMVAIEGRPHLYQNLLNEFFFDDAETIMGQTLDSLLTTSTFPVHDASKFTFVP